MTDLCVAHTFECGEETFWTKVFFDDDYNRRLFLERLRFSTWRVKSHEERGTEIHRVIEAVPPVGELPAALKAVVGEGVGYEEHGVLSQNPRRYRVKVVPNRLADKIRIELEMTTEPISAESCRRIVKGSVNAKIFGVGGLLERKIVGDLEKSYSKTAEFTNKYVVEKGLK